MKTCCAVVIATVAIAASADAFVAPQTQVRAPTRLRMAEVIFPGNKKAQANAGDKLKDVAAKARYNCSYGCEEGKCGTCEHTITPGGKKIRVCIGKVPAGAGPFTLKQ